MTVWPAGTPRKSAAPAKTHLISTVIFQPLGFSDTSPKALFVHGRLIVSKPPFLRFFVDDFFGSGRVATLPGPSVGLYAILIARAFQFGDKGLPANQGELRGLAGAWSDDDWERALPPVLELFEERDGRLFQPRTQQEWEGATKRERQREARARGGKKRWAGISEEERRAKMAELQARKRSELSPSSAPSSAPSSTPELSSEASSEPARDLARTSSIFQNTRAAAAETLASEDVSERLQRNPWRFGPHLASAVVAAGLTAERLEGFERAREYVGVGTLVNMMKSGQPPPGPPEYSQASQEPAYSRPFPAADPIDPREAKSRRAANRAALSNYRKRRVQHE